MWFFRAKMTVATRPMTSSVDAQRPESSSWPSNGVDAGDGAFDGNNLLDYYVLFSMGSPAVLKHAIAKNQNFKRVNNDQFDQFTALQILNLSGNSLSLEALDGLPALRVLCLKRNHITAIGNLEGKFGTLQELDLSYNRLKATAMLVLATLPKLKALNVDYNFLKRLPEQIGERGAFPSLQKLSAAGNGLHSSCFIPISKMRRLTSVSLSHNSITDIPDASFDYPKPFHRLEKLDLTFNCLKEPRNLIVLRTIRTLVKVLLWGNPVASHAGKPVLLEFCEARNRAQSWALEAPVAPRHEHQRFGLLVQQPEACLMNEQLEFKKDPDNAQESEKDGSQVSEKDEKDVTQDSEKRSVDSSTLQSSDNCALRPTSSFMSLKRELAFPYPQISDLDPPRYMTSAKRPISAPVSTGSTKEQQQLLRKVRKEQAQRLRQHPDVVLSGMQERLKNLEGGITGLRNTLSNLLNPVVK